MAATATTIPERLINYRVYGDDSDYLGTASVDLPSIEAMTDTISGAGIAGEVDTPVLGHFQSMTATLHWRTIEKNAINLADGSSHTIDVRGSEQLYDTATGETKTIAVRATMKVRAKSYNLGTFEAGSATDSEQEFEVLYLKLYIGGEEAVEIDKFNFIAKFNGTDMLSSVREDLGLA